MDRTAILSDDTIAYETSRPDATTLVVRIPNARISREASDRIFPKTGGPVSLIHVPAARGGRAGGAGGLHARTGQKP
ncbi:MAG: hypothetical protein R3E53_14785 [Myxococcota bacterium]